MDFKEALRRVVEKVEGGIACMLMASDGLAIDMYTRDGSEFDLDTYGIEHTVVLGQMNKVAEDCQTGSLEELTVKAEKVTAVFRMLTPDYFVALAMDPDGNLGKGRYLLRVASAALVKEVS